ncbi:MAG: hypothetical protein H2172_06475 [Opitutus sp.]|nr:hypothetical protein [Opitutus sp.]MCS6248472.1 hypothetical protein [Opitutus sp.]MCS6273566.1 hypothetical protein [Opitutus sp.]MCS6278568.1 hypothetical protein [Opitutus sp.]MCS6300030.1 hypothetical protein [Opitutus sp.]
MIVIRRLVDRQRSYTGIFLPGEAAQIFPTTDFEHGRILQIYKQDKAYAGIVNDFSDDSPLAPSATPAAPAQTPPDAHAADSAHAGQKEQPRAKHRQARKQRRP